MTTTKFTQDFQNTKALYQTFKSAARTARANTPLSVSNARECLIKYQASLTALEELVKSDSACQPYRLRVETHKANTRTVIEEFLKRHPETPLPAPAQSVPSGAGPLLGLRASQSTLADLDDLDQPHIHADNMINGDGEEQQQEEQDDERFAGVDGTAEPKIIARPKLKLDQQHIHVDHEIVEEEEQENRRLVDPDVSAEPKITVIPQPEHVSSTLYFQCLLDWRFQLLCGGLILLGGAGVAASVYGVYGIGAVIVPELVGVGCKAAVAAGTLGLFASTIRYATAPAVDATKTSGCFM